MKFHVDMVDGLDDSFRPEFLIVQATDFRKWLDPWKEKVGYGKPTVYRVNESHESSRTPGRLMCDVERVEIPLVALEGCTVIECVRNSPKR